MENDPFILTVNTLQLLIMLYSIEKLFKMLIVQNKS